MDERYREAIAYWHEVELVVKGYARSREMRTESDRRGAPLHRHRSEPPALPALIKIPEGVEAYRTREFHRLGPSPRVIKAESLDKLEYGEFVVYSKDDGQWHVIEAAPLDIEIIPILPES